MRLFTAFQPRRRQTNAAPTLRSDSDAQHPRTMRFARCVNHHVSPLISRNGGPIARKRHPPPKPSPAPVEPRLSPFAALPTEIVAKILRLALEESLRESIERGNPISGIRQFRALILTCQFLKAIVDTDPLKLTLRCSQHINPSPSAEAPKSPQTLVAEWDNDQLSDPNNDATQQIRCCKAAPDTWQLAFKLLQLFSVRHAPKDMVLQFGRFTSNPYIRLHDFPHLTASLLQRLGPVFRRSSRRPTKAERETLRLARNVVHSRKDIVSVITGRTKEIQTYSVRAWSWCSVGPMVSTQLSAEVDRWWILKADSDHYWPRCTYIVGYHITGPLVISVDENWRIYGEKARRPPWRP